MSKALYFRVGMDTSVGGCVAPIFPDGTFEYIPIPDLITTESCTYETCKGRHGEYFSKYLPTRLHKKQIHYDPDFREVIPVYGDSTSHQNKFRDLKKGNLLIFYAGLRLWENNIFRGDIDLYIIGYFIVSDAVSINFNNILDQPPNAHSKRYQHILNLGDEIAEIFNVSKNELLDHFKSYDGDDIFTIAEDLNKILYFEGENRINHSSIKNLDKKVRKLISNPHLWKIFLKRNTMDMIFDTYVYLLDTFSKFTLVKGTVESRLIEKAIKISKKQKNKAGTMENVVSDEWSKIFGIPKGLSLQRKNPRFVPNPKYGNKGDFDKLKQILLNKK